MYLLFDSNTELSDGESSTKKDVRERVAMSETAEYKLETFISDSEPSVEVLF